MLAMAFLSSVALLLGSARIRLPDWPPASSCSVGTEPVVPMYLLGLLPASLHTAKAGMRVSQQPKLVSWRPV